MKTALLVCVLVLGSNAFGNEISPSQLYTLSTTATTLYPAASTEEMSKSARRIVADIEEFNQTGEISPKLQQSVNILQEENNYLSVQDALDILIERAESILKAN